MFRCCSIQLSNIMYIKRNIPVYNDQEREWKLSRIQPNGHDIYLMIVYFTFNDEAVDK